MAKKSRKTSTKTVKTPKKTRTKKTTGARKTASPRLALDAMPAARQRAVFRAVEAVLANQRVEGVLTAMHFETNVITLVCPPGTVRRMICRKQNGVVTCGPACVQP